MKCDALGFSDESLVKYKQKEVTEMVTKLIFNELRTSNSFNESYRDINEIQQVQIDKSLS